MSKTEIRYFSGYIRNYKALCAQLGIEQGLSRAERESEILTKAYAEWGMEMMSHIYGAFAFAIWDEEKQKLFCVRDQVGQKQMFYAVCGNEFVCSGDIDEIASNANFEKKLNILKYIIQII